MLIAECLKPPTGAFAAKVLNRIFGQLFAHADALTLSGEAESDAIVDRVQGA